MNNSTIPRPPHQKMFRTGWHDSCLDYSITRLCKVCLGAKRGGSDMRGRGNLRQLLLPIILILMVTRGSTFGTTYYVDPSGSDSANGLSEANAWQTLSHANTVVTSGDTLFLRGGVYTGNNQNISPGRSAQVSNIKYVAYPGEKPHITGYWGHDAVVNLDGDTHITVDGLVISNNFRSVVCRSNSDYVKIYNCTLGWSSLNGTGPRTVSAGPNVRLFQTQFGHFSNTVFREWGYVSSGGGDIGTLLETETWGETGTHQGFHLIEDCTFISGGHDLIRLYSPNCVVRNCYLSNENWMQGLGGIMNGNRLIETGGEQSKRSLIENCTFGWTGIPPDNPDIVSGIECTTGDNIIRKSTFHMMRGPSVSFYDKGGSPSPDRNYVYNCSFYRSGYDSAIRSQGRVTVWFVRAEANRIFNITSYQTGSTGMYWSQGGPTLADQIFSGNFEDTGDPLFQSTTLINSETRFPPDFRLQAGSVCIDNGVWLTTITSPSGSGTTLDVTDAGFFSDGLGVPGVEGDRIQFEGSSTIHRISSIDYANNRLVLTGVASWTQGQGLALPYHGSGPDQGAHEWGIGSFVAPEAPTNLRIVQ